MPSPKYKTSGFPLDLERAERYVVDFDELVFEPEEQTPKKPVKGKKEA